MKSSTINKKLAILLETFCLCFGLSIISGYVWADDTTNTLPNCSLGFTIKYSQESTLADCSKKFEDMKKYLINTNYSVDATTSSWNNKQLP